MNTLKALIIMALIGIFFTSLSLAVPKKINAVQSITDVQFGFPISFVKQDLSATDRNYPFLAYLGSPWENPTSIIWLSFILNFLIYCVAGAFVIFIFYNKRRGHDPLLRERKWRVMSPSFSASPSTTRPTWRVRGRRGGNQDFLRAG